MTRAARNYAALPRLGSTESRFQCVRRLGTEKPFHNGKQRYSTCQRLGLGYEKKVGKKIEQWLKEYMDAEYWVNEWIEYDGKYAQPDRVIILPSNAVLLFEIKLSWVDTTAQLAFYCDLLRALGYTKIIRITICRNMRPETPRERIVRSLDDIYDNCILQLRL